ncbi:hypothetical protein COW36_15655 [bacterium (Candidatus Blackallbacteria) CG17_big_fil_post_rev_8_21_14_2_50_48_46]|uniref:CopG family transcriptional regulator n=1 Tax=bacterium (Candidatus Blackallbacteria) CG17_big_fil_post_rev_8_21_14_2_50_48_46 TaxID=2014261 RepID=A0A2M7G239_9BACT|nr:MAG: hypothetical protein COW64_15195 [bacterium (Candidatus Blackallbacteria) CG18_big_fil_WC_8_21_14_2_50_49_26]PIW15838.1 MAG: hypothetical protein COW36_15655 [bacterium (Candidatus Blackallbacteria) CG17_big_fil_post_rev_8_21_14_2_50_48_46]PIW48213.1 MAG: hypothetical protein COW20_10285 [bacterium (Candidatus Blackallbacteria) CG13_big_fil_rev_8_21_14_2_50_49_14]
MIQAKFSLDEKQLHFLNTCKEYGFKDKSEMVRMALFHFQKNLQDQAIAQSADLYAEIYAQDCELQSLTQTALAAWPE